MVCATCLIHTCARDLLIDGNGAEMRTLVGLPASEGIAVGTSFVYRRATPRTQARTCTSVEAELARFRRAAAQAKEQLYEVQGRALSVAGEDTAAIFQAQQMILEDPTLLDAVEDQIRAGLDAEAALVQEIDRLAAMLAGLDGSYLRERASDVRDVGLRVLRLLTGIEEDSLPVSDSPIIVVAQDLSPSETAQLDRSVVLGFAIAKGGITSHTAILARGFGIPAVVGLGDSLLNEVPDGACVILDGGAGLLIVDPDAVTLDHYLHKIRLLAQREADASEVQTPGMTRDGHRIQVVANIGDVASVEQALALGAEGVGLLRTEFLFLDRKDLPDEDEQYLVYRALGTALGSRPLVIRTLDIGGDKPLPYLDLGQEANPSLGFRAIRVSLAYPELLKTQLRAILRAAVDADIKVMFPMVVTLDELQAVRECLEEARTELKRRGMACAESIEVGVMVEVPAAALTIPILARRVDFFSLGTNDLIQYTLAVDRNNERLGYLWDPLQPAVLYLIKKAIDDAHREGKWVGLCGEMASDLDAVPLLLGMGLDEFSVNPVAIPKVKALIRSLAFHDMQDLVERALQLPTAAAIRALVRETVVN